MDCCLLRPNQECSWKMVGKILIRTFVILFGEVARGIVYADSWEAANGLAGVKDLEQDWKIGN